MGLSCLLESAVVGLDGSSSLLYSLGLWSQASTTDHSISLKFKTLRNSGILLYMEGQSENSLSLQLHRGKLHLLLQKGAAAKLLLHISYLIASVSELVQGYIEPD